MPLHPMEVLSEAAQAPAENTDLTSLRARCWLALVRISVVSPTHLCLR